MAEVTGKMVDDALAQLANEVKANSPRPGTDLMARVLADAAAISPPKAETAQARPGGAPRGGFLDLLFGWTGGAVAALCLSLTIGAAVGMETEPGQIPLFEAADEEMADAGPLAFLPEDIL